MLAIIIQIVTHESEAHIFYLFHNHNHIILLVHSYFTFSINYIVLHCMQAMYLDSISVPILNYLFFQPKFTREQLCNLLNRL